MLLTGLLSSLNKAVELALSGSMALSSNKQDYEDEDDYLLDEKKSMYSSTKFRDNGLLGRLRRTGSNRSLFKLSIKKSWNFSTPSISSTATVVTPPSPTQVAPLWKEGVNSDIKNGLSSSEIHRQEVMFEIIRTEKAFVEDIRYLIEHYVTSIEDSGIRLPPSLKETFKIMPDILLLHVNVSLQLLCIQAIMHPIIPSIAHVLQDLATQFHMYESYLIHHKMAISEIANARKKNNKLGQLIKNLEAEADIPQGRILTLESLLTKPVQRLCKYPLLVLTLLRTTSPDHKDRGPLIVLYNQIDGALKELQERKSEHDEYLLENDDFQSKTGSFGLNRLTSNGRNRGYSR